MRSGVPRTLVLVGASALVTIGLMAVVLYATVSLGANQPVGILGLVALWAGGFAVVWIAPRVAFRLVERGLSLAETVDAPDVQYDPPVLGDLPPPDADEEPVPVPAVRPRR